MEIRYFRVSPKLTSGDNPYGELGGWMVKYSTTITEFESSSS